MTNDDDDGYDSDEELRKDYPDDADFDESSEMSL